ncbi:DNA polymerase III subunit chi [Defluviicoccus vanus]|uniref:DNA polymerase III subunit chi n=1 Tax=Defluviicoccus vanus TaxID=111831 RepID=A0A7H1N0Q2_9PROT|nr:DNA polymerase III subunit chi [Defluviicoccus vanus]QNT69288.1 DNA polymerase III subunit chi [Defluviicoccus vanus]
MTDVAFYHLQRSPLEKVLPKLLEKTLAAGRRALVRTGSAERAEALATTLWTYDPGGWLPHGTAEDGNPADQPIWLTDSDENANGAAFLFLTDGASSDQLAQFERGFDLFDGNDPAAVAAARERWKVWKAAGHVLTYWQQSETGAWERKG